jgi:predicted ATPase/transcriptional regulator with XRE-family HTH domain
MTQEQTFGYYLRLRRKGLDLTREALAERVGCSAATIRKLEAEERRPSIQIAERLAEIFGIPGEEREAFLRFARGNMQTEIQAPAEKRPWVATHRAARVNLPATMTSLVGREQEVTQVRKALCSENQRLVTLIGPPGIGKTRLSIEAARELINNYSDGVFFVELAPLEDADLISSTILQTLGYVEMKTQPAHKELMDGIGDKNLLLVLDNCEHLIEDIAPLVADLLKNCPHLRILATSREALRIPGERLFIVPALEMPKATSSLDLETASKYPAITLFDERARAVAPDFTLNVGNVQPVAAICAQLDGLPLAIELIAARVRLMSPKTLLEHLTETFVLSADGRRAVSARQKTLGDAIGWSYHFLSPEEQQLFAWLGVFTGGFTMEAVETIYSSAWTDTPLGEKPVSDLLLSLLDKSLLQRKFDEHGEVRFSMLVTIRHFALSRLHYLGMEDLARDGHLTYFLILAEEGNRELRGPRQVNWGQRLEAEQDNFRAALDWGLSSQKTEAVLRLLSALGWFWELHGQYTEARNWFEKARILPGVENYPAIYARALNHIGRQCWTQEKYQDAYALLEESRAIAINLGREGEPVLAETLNWFGMAVLLGDRGSDQAKSLLNNGLDLYQKIGDRQGEALSIFHLGIVESDQGHIDRALSYYEKSRAIFLECGDLFFIARVDLFLGHEFLKTGDFEKAANLFEDQLRIDQELHFWDGIADGWRAMGYLKLYQGIYSEAEASYEKSLKVSLDHGLHISGTVFGLGVVALYQGNYTLAQEYFTQLLKQAQKSENKAGSGNYLTGLAVAAAGNNQPERAVILDAAAQAFFEAGGNTYPSREFKDFENLLQAAQEQVGPVRITQLLDRGRGMIFEEAIAYGLGEDLAE